MSKIKFSLLVINAVHCLRIIKIKHLEPDNRIVSGSSENTSVDRKQISN